MRNSEYEPIIQVEDDVFTDAASSKRVDHDSSVVKPETYYGDGPFDPPSSDDEDEELLEKNARSMHPDDPELEDGTGLVIGGHQRPWPLRYLVIGLAGLVGMAIIIGVVAAFSYTGTSYRIRGTKHITMDHLFNGTFGSSSQSVRWVPEAGDGVFAATREGHISLVDLKSNKTDNLVAMADVLDEHGKPLMFFHWEISSDMKYLLVKTDYVKQWRHSSFGNFYVHDIAAKRTWPLIPPSHPPTVLEAQWAPTSQAIAFVSSSDLYVISTPSPQATPIRITTTGTTSVFNGITDWVYEEEVYASGSAMWWSPNSQKLAFLTLDETAVDEFTFPIYNPTEDSTAVVPYPDHVTVKYPKPGFNNPLVAVRVFELDKFLTSVDDAPSSLNLTQVADEATLDLEWDSRLPLDNSVIAEVAWAGNATLLVKEVNRAATNGSVVLFDLENGASNYGQIVRRLGKNGEQGDDGWIDEHQAIYPLPLSLSNSAPAYLDIVPTPEGFNHIALFSPADTKTPRFLTNGEWEVVDTILGIDEKRALVYFQAANPSSIERHIYSVSIPKSVSAKVEHPTALTDTAMQGKYAASFSPEAGFYLLSYQGPSPPWQKIIQVGNADFDYVLSENSRLNDTLAQFEMPIVTYSTIESDGYELNIRELRPPRMDDSGKTKYPVLFRVYGGPFSQEVNLGYNIDWHYFVASTLQYIVVTVDGRGTGWKGRKLRNPVKDNLGHWETIDQVNAAKIWAGKEYVDKSRIGIWGWSYGGFMTSKVVEADAGVHSLGMAVAPVTSWRLYDSIYTERYMDLPAVNPQGYVTASISNVTAFDKVDYLLAHGSGDDNVHYQNSAHLLDMFTAAKIRNYRFRMFTDSDHSIARRGANREIYQYLTDFLVEKWGKAGRTRGW